MIKKIVGLCFVIAMSYACKKECKNIDKPAWELLPPVLLKEVNIPNLPPPYFYFEYDASGKPTLASFASGLSAYNIIYTGNKIKEMQNRNTVHNYRLQYEYDNAERVVAINHLYPSGVVYKKIQLTYSGKQLVKLEKLRDAGAGFIVENTMRFDYHADGNLKTLIDYRHPVNGQTENTFIDSFEQYDNKRNVDGFGFLHNQFFDQLFLLPEVKLQKNNPGKLKRSGDGVHYEISYIYQYNEKGLPLNKKGEMIFTSGSDIGKKYETGATYTYYE